MSRPKDSKMRRLILLTAFVALSLDGSALAGEAGTPPGGDVRVAVDWAMTYDCSGPPTAFPIANWPGALHGVLGLNRDRSYAMELSFSGLGSPAWSLRWEGRLGGAPMQTRGGSAELRVGGPHRLRAIFHEPNNDIVWDVDADANGCQVTIANRLRPGRTDYTLYNGDPRDELRFTHCTAIRTASATCTAQ